MMKMYVKMVVSTQNPLKSRVRMQSANGWRWQMWTEGSDMARHEHLSGSYAVCSVPRAGLAVLGAEHVGGQAAAGVWVVGGHVRGTLWWVVVLGKGWARGHTVALLGRTEWQQPHCLLTINITGLIPRKSYVITGLYFWLGVASRGYFNIQRSPSWWIQEQSEGVFRLRANWILQIPQQWHIPYKINMVNMFANS